MESFKKIENTGSLDKDKIKEAISKLREELKILTDSGTLVINLEKWMEEGSLPLGERGDILLDVIPDQIKNLRQYLGSEKDYTIVKDGPGPRYEVDEAGKASGGYWFVLKLNK